MFLIKAQMICFCNLIYLCPGCTVLYDTFTRDTMITGNRCRFHYFIGYDRHWSFFLKFNHQKLRPVLHRAPVAAVCGWEAGATRAAEMSTSSFGFMEENWRCVSATTIPFPFSPFGIPSRLFWTTTEFSWEQAVTDWIQCTVQIEHYSWEVK